jgi:hypothetical protein
MGGVRGKRGIRRVGERGRGVGMLQVEKIRLDVGRRAGRMAKE